MDEEIQPVCNFDSFVYEARYKLQTAHAHANALIQKMKLRNKIYYDQKAKPLVTGVGDESLIISDPHDNYKQIYCGPIKVKDVKESNLLLFDEKRFTTVSTNSSKTERNAGTHNAGTISTLRLSLHTSHRSVSGTVVFFIPRVRLTVKPPTSQVILKSVCRSRAITPKGVSM